MPGKTRSQSAGTEGRPLRLGAGYRGVGWGRKNREVETNCSASNIKKTNSKTTRGDKTGNLLGKTIKLTLDFSSVKK